MPGTYVPKKVVEAVNVLNNFVKDRGLKQLSAAAHRQGDWDERSSKDRAYYYENQLIAVHKLLRGVAVESRANGKSQEISGVRVF